MNIFVLNTGRCGSMTFIKACQYIDNCTAAHESRINLVGEQRFAYPENHIEADNRLSWLLGRLDQHYGDSAFYIHLMRYRQATAASFVRRMDYGIMKAYWEGVLLLEDDNDQSDMDIALDYVDTVNANIRSFLKDKTHTMDFHLDTAQEDFKTFWQGVGAEGDLDKALAEWDTAHNASE